MKKSVAAAIVLIALLLTTIALAKETSYQRQIGTSWITGAQTLDLPPPPPAPGMEEETPPAPAPQPTPQPTPLPTPLSTPKPETTSEAEGLLEGLPEGVQGLSDRVTIIEQKLQVAELVPKFEDRLNKAEQQAASAANVVQRIDALQSQVDAFKVEIDNFKQLAQRPYVEQPAFIESIQRLESSTKTKAIMSISLAAVALILVIVLLITAIMQRKKAEKENKHLVVQYLQNYKQQGYKPDTLKMHLAACGWSDEFIEAAAKEAGV